jgi:lipoprotein-anchoring transpeptidase ErfK/SrfK
MPLEDRQGLEETTPEDEDRRNRFVPVIIVVLCVLVAAVIVSLFRFCSAPEVIEPLPSPSPSAPSPTPSPSPSPSPSPTGPPEGTYLIAHLPGDVPAFSGPGGTETGVVAGEWWGYPSELPIIDEQEGFLQVRVQPRPNESTAWIKKDAVTISPTPYRIVINVETYRVTLFEDGHEVFTAPAGVGKSATPTPLGHFFVTMLTEGPKPSYGPQVLALSAHSETIENWQGSGDAIGAIHGPIGADARIGTTGGAFTNGCVRLHLDDLAKLYVVPAGTPVDVIA